MEEQTQSINSQLIEQIAKSVTLLYAFLVFCGSLYFHFYYTTFHIDIFRYLDISEISVSFLHILIPTILIIVFLSGYFFIFKILSEIKLKRKSTPTEKKSILGFKIPLPPIDKIQSYWLVISLIICVVFLWVSSEKLSVSMQFSDYREDFWFWFVSISLLLVIVKYNLRFILINTVIIFIMASVYNSVGDVKETLNKAKNNTFIFITDEDTIKTNENFFLWGERKNTFFYTVLRITRILTCQ